MYKNNIKKIEENLFEFLKQFNFADNIEKVKTDYCLVYSKLPRLNNVFDYRIRNKDVKQVIKSVVEEYKIKNSSFTWIISPSSRPKNIESELINNGLKYSSEPVGKLYKIKKKKYDLNLNNHIDIVKIDNIGKLKLWCNIVTKIFEIDANNYNNFYKILQKSILNEKSIMDLYLLKFDSKPICTAALLKGKLSAGIYWVATLANQRRCGFATLLTKFLINEAKDNNYNYVTLQSSQMAYDLYKKIGFKEYCKFKMYKYIKN